MNASIILKKKDNSRLGPFSLNSLFSQFPERQANKGEIITPRNHSLGFIFYLTNGMVKSIKSFQNKNKEVVQEYFTAGELMNLNALNK
ncbi:MAG: hypothetical protein AAGJ18_14405, partial [Bacteroidota bacterium]